jgi:hypothetical protein
MALFLSIADGDVAVIADHSHHRKMLYSLIEIFDISLYVLTIASRLFDLFLINYYSSSIKPS